MDPSSDPIFCFPIRSSACFEVFGISRTVFKLLKIRIEPLWHGRGHRFDPDQVHQINRQPRFDGLPACTASFFPRKYTGVCTDRARRSKTVADGPRLFLDVPLDLRGAPAGSYFLATVRESDNGTYYYPLNVQRR